MFHLLCVEFEVNLIEEVKFSFILSQRQNTNVQLAVQTFHIVLVHHHGSHTLEKSLNFRGSHEKSLNFSIRSLKVLELRDRVNLTQKNTVIFWGIISLSDTECHHKS